MLSTSFLSAALLIASVLAAPASHGTKGYNPFPLKDGYPAPSAKQLKKIELAAGGSLPGGALPSKLTDAAALTFSLIAANEEFEVAYFNQLVSNITDCVPGYKLKGSEKKKALNIFSTIRAQEEIHAIGANAILATAGRPTVATCSYRFPVSSYESAVSFAATFTDVVLSVLPLAQETFAADGGEETGLVPLLGAIIAQEGEQDGFYRAFQGKVPSASPFLTLTNPAYAYNVLKTVIVPGSCPIIEQLGKSIPTYGALSVVSGAAAKDTTVTYSTTSAVSASDNKLVYLTGLNTPLVESIFNVKTKKGVTTFQAKLPFNSAGFSRGLTVAALVKGSNSFETAAAVAAATVAGPGLLEIA